MTYTDIANLIPTMQSIALVEHNLKTVKKKEKKSKDLIDLGVTNIVGVNLIKATAQSI